MMTSVCATVTTSPLKVGSPVARCAMNAISAPKTDHRLSHPNPRVCICGKEHSLDWWDGYDTGREDGFEEGADWWAHDEFP